jgi:hypothetical protein
VTEDSIKSAVEGDVTTKLEGNGIGINANDTTICDVVYGTYDDETKEFTPETKLPADTLIYLEFPTNATTYDPNYYVVAHLIMTGTDAGKVEYFIPDVVTLTGGKKMLVVKVNSLSPFVVIPTDKEVPANIDGITKIDVTQTGAAGGGDAVDTDKSDTGAAVEKPDNTGTIILIGAVAATAVVGGVIAYNWDKLPVHKIEGTVVDANGAAVANATVEIAKDGKVVKTVTTDANGYYVAKVAKGEYAITAIAGETSATAEGSTGTAAQLAIA